MIKIENLSKRYGEEEVIRDFNLTAEKGEIIGIKGETGRGKTTLLRCIAGLEDYKGNIEVNGELSYMFQNPREFPWLNVKKNILLPFRLRGEKITSREEERLRKFAEAMNVREHLNKKISEISGGQKQKIFQIRSLITAPEVVLLDEPFKSLDSETRKQSYTNLFGICRENDMTALVASHNEKPHEMADKKVKLGEKEMNKSFQREFA